jgi:GT2 family glycosyltransferase
MASISIIVATSGRPEALGETLRSLSAVRCPDGWRVELILVENVTQGGAEKLLGSLSFGAFAEVRYLFEPVRGKSRAINHALGQARGEVLLFSDDDVRFPVDWVEMMCEPIFAGRADAVAGGVKLAPHLLRPWMNHTHRAWLASTADYLSPDNPSELCGANMAVRRGVFEQVGGLDEELGPGITGGGEESLFTWQIKRAGCKIEGALQVEVEHHPDPVRLQYGSWVRAARMRGETRAYHAHHWFHKRLGLVRLRMLFMQTKLVLRRLLTARPKETDEGMRPWEMSYLEDIAKYGRYLTERRRPAKYARADKARMECRLQTA